MKSILDEINYPKQLIKVAEDLLGKLLGPGLSEGGELIADRIRFIRLKNQISILNKAQKLLKDNSIKAHSIPIKLLVPLIESASLEEEPKLQLMWSRLLVNAATSNYKVGLHKICINILSNLSPLEAFIIEKIKADVVEKITKIKTKGTYRKLDPSLIYYSSIEFTSKFLNKSQEAEYIMDNLIRIGLMRWEPSEVEDNQVNMEDFICLTNLGLSFLKECTDLQKDI